MSKPSNNIESTSAQEGRNEPETRKVKQVIGIYSADDVKDDMDFEFVCIFSDGSVDTISKKEGHEQYPFKVIAYYEKHMSFPINFDAAVVSK